jgi:hypothetical protein
MEMCEKEIVKNTDTEKKKQLKIVSAKKEKNTINVICEER